MSIKIVKGNYSSVMDSASLTGNRTITLPNSTGTVALTNQLSKVATSNNYNDLSNRPALKTVATSGAYNDLSGKPTLAKVATSGSYNDLSNKPNIPANQSGYITQTWRSGNNWYRKWSDGWIEQGGRGTTVEGIFKTFQLPTKFTTTSYTIVSGSVTDYQYVFIKSLTVSSFQAMGQNQDGSAFAMTFHFYAAGV